MAAISSEVMLSAPPTRVEVNNTLHFLLREPEEFDQRSSQFLWDARRKALVLAQEQELRLPASDPVAALAAWAASQPLIVDTYGQLGRISAGGSRIEYNSGRGFRGLMDEELRPVAAPAGRFVDLTAGGDGRLAAAFTNGTTEHGILVFHLGHRWQTEVRLPDRPLRAVVDPNNRMWVVGPGRLFLCEGEPLPQPYVPSSDRFEPLSTNPHPLRVSFEEALPPGAQPLAICVQDESLYALVHDGSGTQHILERSLLPIPSVIRRYEVPDEVPFAVDLTPVASGRLAMLAPRQAADVNFTQRDCPVVQLRWDVESDTGEVILIRERYPMLSQAQPRFAGSLDGQARYQAVSDVPGVPARPRELHPLQRPRYPSTAATTLTETLDSGQPNTLWHRLYLDGCIPPGCKIEIHAKVFNSLSAGESTPFVPQPELLWTPLESERAFHHSLAPSVEGESGLFDLLLQRDDGTVRRMNGRYLQLRVAMDSDGRHTPAIHALRVYYPRFCYQEVYLPEHMRQEQEADPDVTAQPANGADARERMLAAFEGVLTPLEGLVARTEVLLNPEVTPEPNLPWLAELLGQSSPDQWPASRRRRYISNTGSLQRWRGTLLGVQLAVDIATDGAVQRGQVVLVENFRLRRTMSTILGISMDDEDHPLTLGTGMTGNSIVGDSLILSEKDARTFLALFSPDLASDAERQIVEEFFDRYSNQVTVLLHGDARRLKSAVQQVLSDQMPAHLQWRIFETDHPFVLGLSPLLAVDTFLEQQPPPRRVTLNDTYLGKEGVLRNPVAFSPQDASRKR